MPARRKRTNNTPTFTLPDLHEDQIAAAKNSRIFRVRERGNTGIQGYFVRYFRSIVQVIFAQALNAERHALGSELLTATRLDALLPIGTRSQPARD
jgi:hypothetical protein